ncbi:hypothetical protein [Paraliomyxa miuraensis]|uniref:hypothetical protein n=1 Tax=Paraliomyxa miuraensis TaxID=376150 RepID=UPI0022550AA9|nr:hypothetical protein [Paraliomyxa miuraensis]MCX4241060.1 hypothetical protein [Paraliomyxa miuraensis]
MAVARRGTRGILEPLLASPSGRLVGSPTVARRVHSILGMHTMNRTLTIMAGAAALALAMSPNEAQAAVGGADGDGNRPKGVELEGMIGGAGCIPGRAPCRYEDQFFNGYTAPSFGLGVTLGHRAAPWLLWGGLYRMGMFTPRYEGPDAGYSVAAQHTVAAFVRPILPIWRLDLGFTFAPGYGRQAFYYEHSRDRDYSQGFSMLLGPTIDFWVGPTMFVGAEIDFVFNTQRRVCSQRGSSESCRVETVNQVAPTHQALFGFHIGGVF